LSIPFLEAKGRVGDERQKTIKRFRTMFAEIKKVSTDAAADAFWDPIW